MLPSDNQFSTYGLAQINLKKTKVSFTDKLYLLQGFILLIRNQIIRSEEVFQDDVFNVFKLESLNSKGLTKIHAVMVGKVCYVITTHFLFP